MAKLATLISRSSGVYHFMETKGCLDSYSDLKYSTISCGKDL